MLFFAVGFFILLGTVLKGKGGSGSLSARSNGTPSAGTLPDAPTAAPTPSAPTAISMAPITDSDWIRGGRNAEVSVVEYSDLECPFCKRHDATMKQLISEYDGKVNWVYRHFPLTQLHPKAPKEAEAAECAG